MEVNGKFYSLWGQIVKQKQDWIGGILEDGGDSMDKALGMGIIETEIIDIELSPNGEESAWFGVKGKHFSCGFDVEYGGLGAGADDGDGWLTFHGYMGHEWRIKKPETNKD